MNTVLRKYGTLCLIATLLVACKDAKCQQQKETVVKKETIADNKHQCIVDEHQGPIDPESNIFINTEAMPEFPGGEGKLLQFIAENIHLPKCVTSATVKGRSIIEFVVEKDGTVSDFKVVRSLNKECDEEAVRVLKTMPKWKPGKQGGKAVRVSYQIPISFFK
jgi:protein TonB